MSFSAGVALTLAGVYSHIFRDDIDTLWTRTKLSIFKLVRRIPFIKAKVRRETLKAAKEIEKSMLKEGEVFLTELPDKGKSQEDVLKELDSLEEMADVEWEKGRVSGGLYNCSPEITSLNTEVYRRFLWSNPLHPAVFPYIRKMEGEVVQWCCRLFNGGPQACGTMTSGGTESIMLAMRVYRQIGYEKGIKYPEIVMPATAHAAFAKAGEFFRMKITRVPVDPQTCQVNVKAMARAISRNTVVLVGSVPAFPHGIPDSITDIARLARSHRVGLHVDCCLGGFLVVFMEKAGYSIEPFDFRVKGVTSISADTHKFGYCPKGTSVVLYSDPEFRHHQYFVETNWSGGLYASPITAGSRPGSLIAATWATMLHFGISGYVEATKKVVETTRWIVAELRKIPGLYIMGDPQISVFAIASKDVNIYMLNDKMEKRGWHLNPLQFPPALHMCVTMVTTKEGVAKQFVSDVREISADLIRNPEEIKGAAAVYGASQAVVDRSIVKEIAWEFLDICYSTSKKRAD